MGALRRHPAGARAAGWRLRRVPARGRRPAPTGPAGDGIHLTVSAPTGWPMRRSPRSTPSWTADGDGRRALPPAVIAGLVGLATVGLLVGSFLNVVIVRVPAGESIVRGPPALPRVRPTPLGNTHGQLPVVGWVLRGTVPHLRGRDPAGYTLVEVANAALWVPAGVRFGAHLVLVPFLVLFSVLLALSVIDLEQYILPTGSRIRPSSCPLVAIPLVSFDRGRPRPHLGALVGGVGYFLFLFIPAMIYPKGMGFGDVKLAGLMGLYLGWIHPLLVFPGRGHRQRHRHRSPASSCFVARRDEPAVPVRSLAGAGLRARHPLPAVPHLG